ncbi:hypothetical protein AMECASPLE_015807 [Ameca splendens]|uniref:Uncharacterized protein n=1 Tax=Ameca splendens TaxID=208324 RepID=A0ABV0XR01_9TELE
MSGDEDMEGCRNTYCCRECRSRRAGANHERSEAPSSFTLLLSLTLLLSYVLRSLILVLSVKNPCLILDKKPLSHRKKPKAFGVKLKGRDSWRGVQKAEAERAE